MNMVTRDMERLKAVTMTLVLLDASDTYRCVCVCLEMRPVGARKKAMDLDRHLTRLLCREVVVFARR